MVRKARCARRRFRVCAILDTETTTLGDGRGSVAFPISYQVNDLRDVDVSRYRPGRDDCIHIMRSETEVCAWFEELMQWGASHKVVPVCAAYNLMFDLASLREWLASFQTDVLAQSSMAPYYIDLLKPDGSPALRFWDAMRLQMGGLAAMGRIAGLAKADGDWDYGLLRSPLTPLSDAETFYASRDVQVIPAYLAFLCRSNDWLKPEMFGNAVLTATGLVRQFARRVLGGLPRLGAGESLEWWDSLPEGSRPRRATLQREFELFYAEPNRPASFEAYGARHAAFRGGWSFTGARYAGLLQSRVVSLDVTSMHHTFFPMDVPTDFEAPPAGLGAAFFRDVVRTPLADVLRKYHRPFRVAFHALIRFTGLRPRAGAATTFHGIGLLAEAKFDLHARSYSEAIRNDSFELQRDTLRVSGFKDRGVGCEFCFGKLMRADSAEVWLSEIEAWNVAQVYEWDSAEWLAGEATRKWKPCPAYIALQSMSLFEMKADVKHLIGTYKPGTPYAGAVPQSIPESFRIALQNGTCTMGELKGYYRYVKGLFNGVYGTQAMDEFKPGHTFDGEIHVDSASVVTAGTWATEQPEHVKVLYPYGLRIVARSRMHLLIAMMLIWRQFGPRARVTGGDTDSLKIALDAPLTGADVMQALRPLHDAADEIIAHGYSRLQAQYPGFVSKMEDVGHFDVEQCGETPEGGPACMYPWHMEFWTKCRVSIDYAGHAHVTCAGISAPEWRSDTLREWYERGYKEVGPSVLSLGLGWDTTVAPDLSHIMGRVNPAPTDVFDDNVTDYLGNTAHVHAHMVEALYPSAKVVGALCVKENAATVKYLRAHYGRRLDVTPRVISDIDWR